ncbi:MAG: hypothetical protein HQ526_11330, partial [Actinobacteria bacterium]|nr:hypothetical protein [Actinomycetota bacterium]
MEEVLFFHRASRTLLVTDLIQKFAPEDLSGPQRLLMRLDGLLGPDGSTPREWRLSFWNRRAARSAVQTALAWNPERVVLAHGPLVEEGGTAIVEGSLRWLKVMRTKRRTRWRFVLEGIEGVVLLTAALCTWPLSKRLVDNWGASAAELE